MNEETRAAIAGTLGENFTPGTPWRITRSSKAADAWAYSALECPCCHSVMRFHPCTDGERYRGLALCSACKYSFEL